MAARITHRVPAGRAVCPRPRRGASAPGWRGPVGEGTRSERSQGRPTWSGRAQSSVLLRMRPTCAAGWAPRRSRWIRPTARARQRWRDIVAARLPSQGVAAAALCSSWLSMRIPGNRWCSTAAVGGITDLVDAVAASTSNGFGPFGAYPHRREPLHQRRLSTQPDRRPRPPRYPPVLVLSPFGGRSRMPPAWGIDPATQVDQTARRRQQGRDRLSRWRRG